MATIDISSIFTKKKLDQMLTQFTQLTSLPLVLLNENNEQIFTTAQRSIPDFTFQSSIVINGEVVGYLKSNCNKNQRIAFNFIKSRLEESLNNEYITVDLIKTTAHFWRELNFFYNLVLEIGSVFDVKEICEIIIKKIIKILKVNKAQIFLQNEKNELQLIASYGFSISGNKNIDTTFENWILDKGMPLLLNDIESIPFDIPEKDQTYSLKMDKSDLPLIGVPLKTSSHIFGVIKVCQKKFQKMFNSDDLKLLTSIGYQAGMAINNVYMINKLRETEKIKKEMGLASKIQQQLFPKTVPNIPYLDISGRCVSANAVGGDYYDFFKNGDIINFVLADVSGHGISSALIMSTVRSTLRGLFSDDLPLAEVAYRLNNFIYHDSGTSGMFVTLFYLRYFLSTQKIVYVNSGHNPPILLKNKGNTIYRLQTDGTPAGFLNNIKYDVKSQLFEPGDLLIIYTDGFTEAINEAGKRYGDQKLIDIILSNFRLSAEQIIDRIYNEIYRFTNGISQNDDMTIMIIKKLDQRRSYYEQFK